MLKAGMLVAVSRHISVCFRTSRLAKVNSDNAPPSCYISRRTRVFSIVDHPYSDVISARTTADRQALAASKLKNLSETERQKLEAIKLEHQVALARGQQVPEQLSDYDCIMLLTLPESRRTKYLTYRWKNNLADRLAKEKHRAAVQQRYKERLAAAVAQSGGELEQKEVGDANEKEDPEKNKALRLVGQNLYLRLYNSKVNASQQNRQLSAMRFGLPIVFDFAYGAYMRPQDVSNTILQLQYCYAANRTARSPFNFMLCGLERDDAQFKMLERLFTRKEDSIPFEVHAQSYLDVLCKPNPKVLDFVSSPTDATSSSNGSNPSWLNQPRRFEKEQIVYLSPHSRTDMKRYDPNCVYVIGAYVNKLTDEPVSAARARRDGVRCERLPLDRYVKWNLGKKSLTIDCVIRILLHLAESPERNTAFREAFVKHLPKRQIDVSPIHESAADSDQLERPLQRFSRKQSSASNESVELPDFDTRGKSREGATSVWRRETATADDPPYQPKNRHQSSMKIQQSDSYYSKDRRNRNDSFSNSLRESRSSRYSSDNVKQPRVNRVAANGDPTQSNKM